MEKYEGKLFSILGDSISTFEGVNPKEYNTFYTETLKRETGILSADKTWWGHVIKKLGGKLLVNNSWSGSLVCKHPQCDIESYGASDYRTSLLGKDGITPNVIMVYMGTNDWGYNMPIDEKSENKNDLSIFRVAYNTMLKKIKNNYPNAEIWCFTLAVSDGIKHRNFTLLFTKEKSSLLKYCQVIRECAIDNGCNVIDIFDLDNAYETIDELHPNLKGMETIAKLALNQIKILNNR